MGIYQNYVFAAELNGEVMNDALVDRERLTEEQLGINIVFDKKQTINDVYNNVKASVLANDNAYQLVLTHCITGVDSLMTGGLLYDWNKVETVDFEHGWWNHDAIKSLQINGKLYYTISDFMLPDPNAVLFNKEIVKDLSLEDPYQLVRDGKWTVDKLIEISQKAVIDLNGDAKYDYQDRYGFVSQDSFLLASFFPASEIFLTGDAADGTIELTFYNDRTVTLIEKLDQLFNKSGSAYWFRGTDSDHEKPLLRNGQALFQLDALNNLKLYRDCEIDYGILPYPKFDEKQERYLSNDWSGLMAIPINVDDPALVGMVAELLAFYSADTAIPAYFDLLLGEKLSRDADSREMLSIIYDNITYDRGLNYFGWGKIQSLNYAIRDVVLYDGSSNIASHYEKMETGANAEIQKLIDAISDLDEG